MPNKMVQAGTDHRAKSIFSPGGITVHTRGWERLQEKGLELASTRRRRAIQRGRAYRGQHADIL